MVGLVHEESRVRAISRDARRRRGQRLERLDVPHYDIFESIGLKKKNKCSEYGLTLRSSFLTRALTASELISLDIANKS